MGHYGAMLTGPDKEEKAFIEKLLALGFSRHEQLRSTFVREEITVYVTDTKALTQGSGRWRPFAEVLAEIDPRQITTFACGCRFDENSRCIVGKCTDDPNRPAIGESGRIPCVRDKWTRDGSMVGSSPHRLFLVGVKDKERRGEPWIRFAILPARDEDAAIHLGNEAALKLMEPRGGRMHGEAEVLEVGRWYTTKRMIGYWEQ